jgi:alanine dehydrogenase
MRVLTASEVRQLVPMRRAVDLMKAVFADHSRDRTLSPLRTPLNLPDGSGVVLFMPAFVPESASAPAAIGAKVVSVFTGNHALGLPTINALVVVFDPATGVPHGVLEGASITALRTGAVSGAATDLLARADARVLAVIGAGAQGLTQAAGVCSVRDIAEIRVADLSSASVQSFAERLELWDSAAAAKVRPCASAQEAVTGADVICTATTSTQPVFEDGWLAPGVHINAVGAYTPAMQEIPDETIARSLIVVDEVEAALHEAGDLIQSLERGRIAREDIATELGQVVTGDRPGRQSATDVTFFKSVGNAIQDMIVAGAALQEAAQRDTGQVLSLT